MIIIKSFSNDLFQCILHSEVTASIINSDNQLPQQDKHKHRCKRTWVCLNMTVQCGFHRETLPTLITLVRFLACVYPDVSERWQTKCVLGYCWTDVQSNQHLHCWRHLQHFSQMVINVTGSHMSICHTLFCSPHLHKWSTVFCTY